MDGKNIDDFFRENLIFQNLGNFCWLTNNLSCVCPFFLTFCARISVYFSIGFRFFRCSLHFFIGFRFSVFPIYTFMLSIFPQRRKLTGSSAQNSSGVHWCRRRRRVRFNEVPEKVPKGPEKIWEALVQSQVTFNRVPEMRNIFTSPFTLRDNLKTLPCRYAFRWTSDKR